MTARPTVTILDAMGDANLFAPWFRDPATWAAGYGIRGHAPFPAAEGRDPCPIENIHEMQRDDPRFGGELRPVAKASEMSDIPHPDQRDSMRARPFDAVAYRLFADDLAESEIAIQDDRASRVRDHRRRLIGANEVMLTLEQESRRAGA